MLFPHCSGTGCKAIDHDNQTITCINVQVGRERQRFDFDDFDTVPQKFNI